MKALKNRIKIHAIFLTLLAAGCLSGRANLVEEQSINLQIVPSDIKISSVAVCRDGEKINISGKLYHAYYEGKKINGHVDIVLISPEQKILKQMSVQYFARNQVFGKHATHSYNKHFKRYFEAAVRIVPPQGATIKIAFHNSPLDGNTQTDCGLNKAAI